MKNSLSSDRPLTVLLAPNAFKESLEAERFCSILAEELQLPGVVPVSLPMCDGGDGTARILSSYLDAVPVPIRLEDALGRTGNTVFYRNGETALADLSAICGIRGLKEEEYDVMNADTRGVGQLMLELARLDIRRVILGLGGSASVDGGTGALAAMGMKIRRKSESFRNGLIGIEDIDASVLKYRFSNMDITLLCDVDNPLCGPEGAVTVFGPQKGGTPEQLARLEKDMENWGRLLGKAQCEDTSSLPKGGAAGGISAAFHALLGARLLSGSDYSLRLSGFCRLLSEADLVVTGEGRLDSQSMQGKLPGKLAALCREAGKPLIAVTGSHTLTRGFMRIYSLSSLAGDIQASISRPEPYLRQAAALIRKGLLDGFNFPPSL